MTVPGLREWIFSVKTFAAAVIAFYIALAMQLDHPYWAMTTVYMVSQPLSGAMRSKGTYRFCGTFLGAVAAIVLVPNLANAPVLLSAGLALWTGTCLFFSLLDRTPRSYVFMLAGYTAAVIGFPSVDQPDGIFQTAVARTEEISIGILCATIIGSLVFPRPVAPVLLQRMEAWFATARRWALASLSGQREEEEARTARRAMAGASIEIHMLTTYLAFDTSVLQTATRPVGVLQQRMLYLLPVLSGIANRVAALRGANGVTSEIQAMLDRVAAWLAAGPETSPEAGRRLREDLVGAIPPGAIPPAAAPPATPQADWPAILRAALLTRLTEFVDIVQDIRALRQQVLAGSPHLPPLALPPGVGPDATRHRDYGMALLSGFAAALAIGVICAFWIATAWSDGASAALMAAILGCFFATQDNPVPAIVTFLRYTVLSIAIDLIYLFVILPQLSNFEMLAVVLAPVLLALGTCIAMPATFMFGLAISVNSLTMLALTDTYDADFASFLNAGLASVFGIAVAAVVTALVRSVGAEFSAQRLRSACWRDIARAASHQGAVERPALTAVLLDRLADLTSRLAASDRHADIAVQSALRDVGVGLSIVDVQRDSAALPPAAQATVRSALADVGAYYALQAPAPPAPVLQARIDRTIAEVAGSGAQPVQTLLVSLLGIRQALFPDAATFHGAPPAPAQAEMP